MTDNRPSKNQFALWRQRVETYGGHTLEKSESLALFDEIERLERLVYVPGLWRCAKCGCETVSANLHVVDGAFSANNEPQRCPNSCGPMWRVTERDAGNRLCDRLEALTTRGAVGPSAVTHVSPTPLELLAERNEQLHRALAGEAGLVQLLTARSDLQHDRDAILSNHRHIEALSILEQSGSAEPIGDAAAAAGAETTAALSRTADETVAPRAVLEQAVEVIKTWHNMGGNEAVWDIYWNNAPEMKPLREALARTAVEPSPVKYISPTPLELLAERNERLERDNAALRSQDEVHWKTRRTLLRERAELRDCLEKTHEALCIAAKKAGFLPPPELPADEPQPLPAGAVWDNERQTFRCPSDEPSACIGCDKGLLLRDGVHIETYLPSGAEYVWGKCTAAEPPALRIFDFCCHGRRQNEDCDECRTAAKTTPSQGDNR